MRKLLLLALLSVAPTPVDASCAQVILGPTVLTHRVTAIPQDGGVLVGYGYVDDREYESEATWTAGKVKLTRTELAPGLSVLKPSGIAGFKIATKNGHARGSFTIDSKAGASAMPAPAPKALSSSTAESFRSTTTTVTLKLSAAPPADAVAIIAYDEQHKALLYEQLPDTHDKLLEFAIHTYGGHCGTPHPANESSIAGKTTFAWVDAFGRLSPQSKAIAP